MCLWKTYPPIGLLTNESDKELANEDSYGCNGYDLR